MPGFDARVGEAWTLHHERLWRSLLVWSGDAEIASDAVAEAFAQVLRRGPVVDDVGKWVWAAAFRIASGTLSTSRRDAPLDDHAVGLTCPDGDMSEVAALRESLAKLDPDDRTVVVMCLVGGWSAGAVADLTGGTAGAVRVRLHRAKRRLRRLLEVSND